MVYQVGIPHRMSISLLLGGRNPELYIIPHINIDCIYVRYNARIQFKLMQ